MFAPTPQIPSTTAVPPIPTSNNTIALELTAVELEVVKKYTLLYNGADKDERYNLLKGKILPRIFQLNQHLPSDAWKSRKIQIRRWFQNQSRKSVTSYQSKRKLTTRQVACHVYKQEIDEIVRERSNGAKPGGQDYMSAFQGSVSAFMEKLDDDKVLELEEKRAEWLNKSFPIEVQRKTAERSAHAHLQESAESQYKEMGMRSVVWEFHENKAGAKLYQLHDFNENLGKVKVQSFAEKFPDAVSDFRDAWIEYMKYCYEIESGEVIESVVENRSPTSLIELDRDMDGYPLVPQEAGNLINMKRILRSFITIHYRFASGRKSDRVPWKQIKDHTSHFIDSRYLPEPMTGLAQIDDPSDMKKEQITRLLEFWRRPVNASEIFRFRKVLVNNKSEETTAALYIDSFAPVLRSLQNDTVRTDDDLQLIDPKSPTSASFLGVSTLTPAHTPIDPNIDPALQQPIFAFPSNAVNGPTMPATSASFLGVSTLTPAHPPIDPNIDPALQQPIFSFPSNAVNGPTMPDSDPRLGTPTPLVVGTSTDVQAVTMSDSDPAFPTPSSPTPASGDSSLKPPPRPRPRPQKKVIQTSHQQEEDLGRPKRVQKRKTDIYLEAEEKNELAKRRKK